MSKWRLHDLAVIVALILLVLVVASGEYGSGSEAGFSKSQVLQMIENAADCHAEFFYTHPPEDTGVGIADAVRACKPFKEGR